MENQVRYIPTVDGEIEYGPLFSRKIQDIKNRQGWIVKKLQYTSK